MDSKVREGSRAMQEQKKQKLFFSNTTGCLGNSVRGGGGWSSCNVGCKVTVFLLLLVIAWPNPHPPLKLGIVLVIPS